MPTGVGDSCDPSSDLDTDGDLIPDASDNCPLDVNPGQEDTDGDGARRRLRRRRRRGRDRRHLGQLALSRRTPTRWMPMPTARAMPAIPSSTGTGMGFRTPRTTARPFPTRARPTRTANGIGTACDPDNDDDGIPDACGQLPPRREPGPGERGLRRPGRRLRPAHGHRRDGFGDGIDNCPSDFNPGQGDLDADGLGNVCDPDNDNDEVPDVSDNCPLVANPGQADTDGDGKGDACDASDGDGDGIPDASDNCPSAAERDQADADADGIGDACESEDPFVRGDANTDRKMNIADPIFGIGFLFMGTEASTCLDAMDANDDGRVDIADPIFMVGYLFLNGIDPRPPFPAAGSDPTPDRLNNCVVP